MHDLEAAADDARAAEQGAHLLGRGIGGDVVILRVDAGDQVAHRAADDIGLVPGLLQGFAGTAGAQRHMVAANAVARHRNHGRRSGMRGIAATKHAAQELADHGVGKRTLQGLF